MGGDGSGRKPDVIRSMREQERSFIYQQGGNEIMLPNLGGVEDAARKDMPGSYLTGTYPGGTTLFLRADETWASPVGGSDAFPIGSVFISVVSTNPATLLGYGTWSAFGTGRVLVGIDSGDTDFDVVEETGGAKTKTILQANLPNISTGTGTSHNHAFTGDALATHNHTQDAHTHVLTELRDATTGGSTTNIALTADTSSTLGTKVTGSRVATNQAASAGTPSGTNAAEASHTHSLGGSGTALDVVNPYIVVYMWKRTA